MFSRYAFARRKCAASPTRPLRLACLVIVALCGLAPGAAAAAPEGTGPPEPPLEWQWLIDARTMKGWRQVHEDPFGKGGEVGRDGARLALEGRDTPVAVTCTREVPTTDYELEFLMVRTQGAGRLVVVFPIGEQACELVLGSGGGNRVGLKVLDGRGETDPANPTSGHFAFRKGHFVWCELRVTRNRVKVRFMDKTIREGRSVVDLPIEGHTFELPAGARSLAPLGFAVPKGTRVTLGHVRWRRLERDRTAAKGWQQLFDGVSLDGWHQARGGRFVSSPGGIWARSGENFLLISQGDVAAGCVYERGFPRMNYEVAFRAMRTRGKSHAASVVFPVGDSYCAWALGDLERSCGLDQVDGKPHTSRENPTYGEFDFVDGYYHLYRLRVTRQHIEAWIDEERVVDIPTKGHVFTLYEGYHPLRPFGFFADRKTRAHITDIWLHRLGEPPGGTEQEPTQEPPPMDYVIRVSATVDGLSDLVILPGALRWEHHDWKKPWDVSVEGEPWKVAWAGKNSAPRKSDKVPASLRGMGCTINQREGRGRVFVRTAEPDRIVVRFNDRHPGADRYVADIVLAKQKLLALIKATNTALQSIRWRKYDYADAMMARVFSEAHRPEVRELLRELLPLVLTQARSECRMLDFHKARAYLAVAERIEDDLPDVAALRRWMQTVGEPLYSDTFYDTELRAWETDRLDWRVDGTHGGYHSGHLVCEGGFRNAVTTVKGLQAKNFALAFDACSRGEAPSAWFGAIARRRGGRFLYCFLSDEHDTVRAGGATGLDRGPTGPAEGVTLSYQGEGRRTENGRAFPVHRRREYRVALWCVDGKWSCYVDGDLVAQGTDAHPVKGALGFYAYGGRATFDDFVVCKPVQLPEPHVTPPE